MKINRGLKQLDNIQTIQPFQVLVEIRRCIHVFPVIKLAKPPIQQQDIDCLQCEKSLLSHKSHKKLEAQNLTLAAQQQLLLTTSVIHLTKCHHKNSCYFVTSSRPLRRLKAALDGIHSLTCPCEANAGPLLLHTRQPGCRDISETFVQHPAAQPRGQSLPV